MRTKIISIAIILFVVAGFASAYDHRMRIDQQPLATSDAESEQEGKIVDLKADVVYPINLDGELRTGQEITFALAQEKVRFFYPKGLVWNKSCATV